MNATLIVPAESDLDSDFTRQLPAGTSIAQIIDEVGPTFGYSADMIPVLNNVAIYDRNTVVQEGDTLLFRVGTKERGNA
jgi:hypothetical protein